MEWARVEPVHCWSWVQYSATRHCTDQCLSSCAYLFMYLFIYSFVYLFACMYDVESAWDGEWPTPCSSQCISRQQNWRPDTAHRLRNQGHRPWTSGPVGRRLGTGKYSCYLTENKCLDEKILHKLDSLCWFSQRRTCRQVLYAGCVRRDVSSAHMALFTFSVMHRDSAKCHIFGGCAPRWGAMTPKFELGRDFFTIDCLSVTPVRAVTFECLDVQTLFFILRYIDS